MTVVCFPVSSTSVTARVLLSPLLTVITTYASTITTAGFQNKLFMKLQRQFPYRVQILICKYNYSRTIVHCGVESKDTQQKANGELHCKWHYILLITYPWKRSTVQSRLSDINRAERRSDNNKTSKIRKTNKRDEYKYQLCLRCY